jgi:hypothetical protein
VIRLVFSCVARLQRTHKFHAADFVIRSDGVCRLNPAMFALLAFITGLVDGKCTGEMCLGAAQLFGLAVKNGAEARRTVASSIPLPVSVNRYRHARPR